MRVLAMLDGTLADPEARHLRVDDLGLIRGDGIFETILVVAGEPRELGPHLDRLARSAAMLQLPPPDRPQWERCVRVVLDAWQGDSEMALKLVYTRGPEFGDGTPTGFALGMPIGARTLRNRATGVRAVTLDRGYEPEIVARAPWLLLGAKSLSYAVNMAAIRYAEAHDAEEAIFIAADGSVLEGPTSSVVVVRGRTLRTTPPSSGILPGTTQGALFRAAEQAGWVTKVEPLTFAELTEADGLFLASSVRKITRVHTLDGVALPDATWLHGELGALYESEYR
ncbi:MAG: aminodeoxychorismate lyase [Actinophytocola sp.]|uniref:aminodeoxychorismate lyase n=1 Tax=Actinophytocola sp. TaxID=1872138 RepID=UPI00132B8D41|nr:aminodeoxychorismate lyase [Actinophytocola sp.]MPZ80564.1 aminodeoxychorismate lyase [Actinophytocola sp.]